MRSIPEMALIRKATGISPDRVAEKMGLTAPYISSLEKGDMDSEYARGKYQDTLFELCQKRLEYLPRLPHAKTL